MGKIIENFDSQKIQLDIANWISREPYEAFSNIERKIKDRLQRKYKLRIDSRMLEEVILRYRKIYKIAKENLSQYILPSESGYAEPQCVQYDKLENLLSKKFSKEQKIIIRVIIEWVIDHEYFR